MGDRLIQPKDIARLLIFGLLTYGLLYFSYKWYAIGGDFYYYYELYKAPFSGDTVAPFHYRRLTPLLVWLIAEIGIYYPLDVAFDDPDVDQRLWFAAFLVNYAGLVLAAGMSAKIADVLMVRERVETPWLMTTILAGILIFLSFLTLQKVLTVRNDGLTWFFTATLIYAALTRRFVVFAVFCIVGIVQKEILPLMGGAFVVARVVVDAAAERSPARMLAGLRERLKYIGVSAGAFVLYFVYRAIDPRPGNPEQTDPIAIVHRILDRVVLSPEFSKEMLLNGYLSQNIAFLTIVFAVWQWRRLMPATRIDLVSLALVIPAFFLLGYGVGMGSSVARMCGFFTPVLTAYIAVMLACPSRSGATGSPGASA